jgi:hypothetical protein
MKYLLISLLFCLPAFSLAGQNMPFQAEDRAREAADYLADRYSLDDEQSNRMYKVQLRKYKQLNKLSLIREQDPDFYIEKLESVYTGTDGSIRLMLKEDQMRLYEKDLLELRKKRAEMTQKLKEQGKTGWEVREETLLMEDRE